MKESKSFIHDELVYVMFPTLVTLFVLSVAFFVGAAYHKGTKSEQIPEAAIELWESIEEICTNNNLEPETKPSKGTNGNLIFLITCK